MFTSRILVDIMATNSEKSMVPLPKDTIFVDNIFKYNFFNENLQFQLIHEMKCVPVCPIDNNPASIDSGNYLLPHRRKPIILCEAMLTQSYMYDTMTPYY